MHQDNSKMDKSRFYHGTCYDSNVPIHYMRQVRVRGAELPNLQRFPLSLYEKHRGFLLCFEPLRSELHRKRSKTREKVGVLLLTFLCGSLDFRD